MAKLNLFKALIYDGLVRMYLEDSRSAVRIKPVSGRCP